ncbi:MAG: GrpB family protein, partial [Ornithinibacter sp.]
WALRFRDWLRADAAERAAYATMKTRLAAGVATTEAYAEAKEPWFEAADGRARAWADRTGWQPPTTRDRDAPATR